MSVPKYIGGPFSGVPYINILGTVSQHNQDWFERTFHLHEALCAASVLRRAS